MTNNFPFPKVVNETVITIILIKLQFRHVDSYFISYSFVNIWFISGNINMVE